MLAGPVLRLLWKGGEFGETAVAAAEFSLLYYVASLIGLSGLQIVNRALYSLKDTRTPPLVGIGYTLIIVALAVALMRTRLQYASIAAATSIGVTIGLILLFHALRRSIGGADGRAIAISFLRISLASALLAVVALLVSRWTGNLLGVHATRFLAAAPQVGASPLAGAIPAKTAAVAFQVLASLLAGGVSYLLALHLLRAPELTSFREVLRRRRTAGEPFSAQ